MTGIPKEWIEAGYKAAVDASKASDEWASDAMIEAALAAVLPLVARDFKEWCDTHLSTGVTYDHARIFREFARERGVELNSA